MGEGGRKDTPDVDERFGFVGGDEVVDVYDERIERDDLAAVLMCAAGFEELLWTQLLVGIGRDSIFRRDSEPLRDVRR